jgi:SAM-dependent methyltransferase
VHLGGRPGWIGVDVAQGPLRQAARRLPGTHFVCADAQRLPFADAIADAVLVRDVLHHVPNRVAVLREARRILAPGGALGLIEPNRGSPMILAQALLVPAERGVLVSSRERMLAELGAAGFAQLEVERAQPLPLARLFHPRLKHDGLARRPGVTRALRLADRLAASTVPGAAWMYLVGRALA